MGDLLLRYRECGAETREDYLRELANDNGLPFECVRRLANRLGEHEDTLHEHNRGWLHNACRFHPRMRLEVIDGDMDGATCSKLPQVPDEQFRLQ